MIRVFQSARHRTLAAAVCFCFCAPLAIAQPYYPNMVYGPKEEIAPGVTWQELSNASPLWKIDVIEVDMENRNVELLPVYRQVGNVSGAGNQRTSVMAARVDAIAAINAGYYDTSNFMTNSYTVIDGQFIGGSNTAMRPENNRSILGFSGNHQAIPKRTKVSNAFVPQQPADFEKITDFIAGRGHFVTANGVVVTQDNEGTSAAHNGDRHPRTAIGYSLNPYRATMVTIDGRQPSYSVGMTYLEMARLMADLGVEQSISLDGGGSTTAWVKGHGIVNSLSDGSERAVVSAWTVVEANTMDNTVEEVTVTGDWTTDDTHVQHYYLDQLLSSSDEAASTVTWTPELGRSGIYKVYAWWTADPSRATNAPYQIVNMQDTVTVTVNQRQGGGKWNLLGVYGFEDGTNGSVSLSNSATGTVSADAVRFVRIGDIPDPISVDYVVTGTVFESDFETSEASNFTVRHRSAADNSVQHAYDYSSFSQTSSAVPAFIPQSPSSTGDGTRALKFEVNRTANTVNALTAALTGIEPQTDMRITFDAWLNHSGLPASAGSTEFLTFGASGNTTQYAYPATSYTVANSSNQPFTGFYFQICSDGDNPTDYRYYDGNGTGGATGNNAARANFLGTAAVDHVDFTAVFPSSENPGTVAKQWVTWEVLVLEGKIRLIAHRPGLPPALMCDWFSPNANATMTNLWPHVGLNDPYSGSAASVADSFLLIDNLKVESIAVPPDVTHVDSMSIH